MSRAFDGTHETAMQTFELIDTCEADYLLDAGGLRDRFVEVDDTTLASVTPVGNRSARGTSAGRRRT